MPACPNPHCKGGNTARNFGNYFRCEVCDGKGFLDSPKRPLPALQSQVLDPSALTPTLLQNLAKMARGQNSRARQAGYKDHAEREASGWTPVSAFRERGRRQRAKRLCLQLGDQGGRFAQLKDDENPFLEDTPPTPFNWL